MLFEQLLATERRAAELKEETERLRRIKDEAKQLVMAKHPYLFAEVEEGNNNLFDSMTTSQSEDEPSFLTKDLRDIRGLLAPASKAANDESNYVKKLRKLQSDVNGAEKGYYPPQQQNPPVGGALGSNWPANCIPVPIETFTRLVAESEARQRLVATHSDGDKGNNYADDTSNDAADLSQENALEDVEDEDIEEVRHVHYEKPKPAAPKAQPRTRKKSIEPKVEKKRTPIPKDNDLSDVEVPKQHQRAVIIEQREESPARMLSSDEIRYEAADAAPKIPSPASSNEPDLNFAVNSDNSQADKLYSTASDTTEESDQRPPPAGTSKPAATQPVTKTKLALPSLKSTTTASSSSESSSSHEAKPVAPPPKNPLTAYAQQKFGQLNLNSDSSSREEEVKKKEEPTKKPYPAGQIAIGDTGEESLSGPEGDEEDDFWN